MAVPSVPPARRRARLTALALLAASLAGCLSGDATKAAPLTMPLPLWSFTRAGVNPGPSYTEANGAVLVRAFDSVLAINAVAGAQPAGSIRWSRPASAIPLGGIAFEVASNRVVFAGGQLVVLDMANGATLYTDPLGSTSSLPSTDGTSLFLARTTPAYRMDAISPVGVSAWSTPIATACPTTCSFAGTAVSGDTVFLAGTQFGPPAQTLVMAFNRLTGAELWRSIDGTLDSTVTFPPVVIGKQLVLVGTAGQLVYAMNRATKAITWQRIELGNPVVSRVVPGGTRLVIPSQFLVESVSADTGSTNWSASSSASIVRVAACPATVAVATGTDLYIVNAATGVITAGRESISFAGGSGDLYSSSARLYVSTVNGGTLLGTSVGAALAAYTCP